MIEEKLKGWDVSVEKTWIEGAPESPGAEPKPEPGWTLVFEEKIPRTGDKISFTFGEDVKNYLLRELSGGVILPPGSTRPIDQFRAADDGA